MNGVPRRRRRAFYGGPSLWRRHGMTKCPAMGRRCTEDSTAQHGTAQHIIARYIIAQYIIAQYIIAQYIIAQYIIAQHIIAQHGTS
jgi:hypothetical protein